MKKTQKLIHLLETVLHKKKVGRPLSDRSSILSENIYKFNDKVKFTDRDVENFLDAYRDPRKASTETLLKAERIFNAMDPRERLRFYLTSPRAIGALGGLGTSYLTWKTYKTYLENELEKAIDEKDKERAEKIRKQLHNLNLIMRAVGVAATVGGALGGLAWERITGRTPEIRAAKKIAYMVRSDFS